MATKREIKGLLKKKFVGDDDAYRPSWCWTVADYRAAHAGRIETVTAHGDDERIKEYHESFGHKVLKIEADRFKKTVTIEKPDIRIEVFRDYRAALAWATPRADELIEAKREYWANQ